LQKSPSTLRISGGDSRQKCAEQILKGSYKVKQIRGDAKNLRTLLSGAKYAIDYYQREYRWGTKHISELLDDLAEKFLQSYDSKHERTAVENYEHYFLGSIIVSDKDGRKFIIDGQQRLKYE
jgi:uncharacterized protein with ParB-like and HNH nuclease domain